MNANNPDPTITTVLHDIGALPAPGMREIQSLLQRHLDVRYTGSTENHGPDGTWQIEIGYRLSPLAKAGPTGSEAGRRIKVHCELLDHLNVSNGVKAIAIALHKHWLDDLRKRFGEAVKPSTVKRWRLQRRRAADPARVLST